ncbi:MAG: HEAT repeat domain-containing protein [Oscillatoriaceae bacterium SKW80]|nr:HEAT repeat domain-containing protein [Oscillatoriaceae bacterium SKYG93]MCX8120042.1 HEAT repeat domain-containing protein [Oscillatoriaceae bacterium SKW80]MDW8454046.1 HEAT repeat domain-containing protein [Oscillatoriaceae cyanobacterium SKYGB_i_bin93]HIK29717.1 HEAT repeat domain-containing protein [Oscillatoriaceae cyanobacterium M7585_C2015_266]
MIKYFRNQPLTALRIAILCLSLPLFLIENSETQVLASADINYHISQFRDDDESNDPQAIDALVKIGERAVSELLTVLKEPDARVRASAAKVLGKIGSESENKADALASTLVEYLNDSNQEVRRAAAEALGRIGSIAVPKIVEALQAEPTVMRTAAAEALGQMGTDAKEAIPSLVARLQDSDWRVRSAAARALGKIGTEAKLEAPALVPPLIHALEDSDPEVRRSAAEALGRIGSPVVPDLINALQDENASVRAAAAEALGQIGADAREVVPHLIARLQDSDWRVRSGAAKALGTIGSQASLEASIVVEPLIDALKDKDPEVRRAAAEVLVKIGSEAVPKLIAALDDERSTVRAGVAWVLGQIGAGSASAVPQLIARLQDNNEEVRAAAAEALGRMGVYASKAITPLSQLLYDSDKLVRGSAAETLRRIAGSLQDESDKLRLSDLEKALSDLSLAESALNDPKVIFINDPLLFKFSKEEIAVALARSLKALKTEKQTRFFELGTAWFFRHKWLLAALIYIVSLPTVWLFILWLRPLWLLNINQALKRYTLPLPGLKDKGFSLRHLLFVGFFDYHPRVLDAWVAAHVETARARFSQLATVSERSVYIPLPVVIDGNTIANLTGKELRSIFANKQVRLLIWGEAGSGKTSLACQLGKWAMSDNPEERLCEYRQLPILIEQEFDYMPENNWLQNSIRWRLQSLIGSQKPPHEELVKHLTLSGRLLVILDRISEMSEATRSQIRPTHPDFLVNALVVTSRLEETLDGVPKTTLKPLRVEGNRLSSFMEAYLTQRGMRDRFSDLEFFDACSLLSLIVGQRNITVLLAKLYAEQLIAFKEGTSTKGLANNIPDLMLSYLNELNRSILENRFDDALVHHDAKIVAWECLKQTFRPSSTLKKTALASLAGKQAELRLEYLEKRLRLLQTCGASADKIRFSLAPLAEYLAGLHLVELYGSNAEQWRLFLKQTDTIPGVPKSAQGFLLALRDCCLAKGAEFGVPHFVIEELSKRAA